MSERRVPDECDLVLVHPWLQLQTGILPKRGHDEAEDQSDADEHGREDDLKTHVPGEPHADKCLILN